MVPLGSTSPTYLYLTKNDPMPAERYFLDHSFKVGDILELDHTEFHHLARVMRAQLGDSLEVVNGKGTLAQASLIHLGKNKASIELKSVHQEPEKSFQIILAQAIPKPNRLDFILEKGTELGVDQFWLFPGHLSVKKDFSPNQLERASSLTIAAMKQCGRLTLPTIEIKSPLDKWSPLEGITAFFGDVGEAAPPFEKELTSSSNTIIFFTGPESGFDAKEVEILKNIGAKGVKLHPNILRTDTASLVALSLISHKIFLKLLN